MKQIVSTRSKTEKSADKVYYLIRLGAFIGVLFLLVPGLNPSRVSGMINENLSMFTAGISYSSLTDGFARALKKGWIEASSLQLLHYAALLITIGVIAFVAVACMSLGNNKMRRLCNFISLAGCILSAVGSVGIYVSYTQIALTDRPEKIEPMFKNTYWILLVVIAVMLVLTIIEMVLSAKNEKEAKMEMKTKYQLFLMLLPFMALSFVFSYLPLLGWRYAFFDYSVGETLSMDKFVGFKWFVQLFKNSATVRDIVNVMKNTLAMSFLGLATSWMPMAFAIFLNEIKVSKYRRFVQTFTTIPNFISWVLVYAIAFCIFSTDGFISSIMVNLGIWSEGKNMLMSGEHTWLKMWAWGTWKGIGWSAIIYIAGISGIDQQLYEAATVDGAGRFQRMWHITIPGLLPTFCVLFLMAVANILSNGMDQYLVFENSMNASSIRVLDLYVYELGIGQGTIPLTTVVSMAKSIISVILLFAANGVSKLIRGESIM